MRYPLENFTIDIKKTMLLSLGFHLLLLLLFLFIKVGWEIEIPEFAEISFVRVEAVGGRSPAQPIVEPLGEPQSAESELIKLPKRRMLEEELPQLQARDAEKVIPEEKPALLPQKRDVFAAEGRGEVELPVAEKEIARPADFNLGKKDLPQRWEDLGAVISQPFEIEGEAAQRSILSKVIPEYPEGLQKQAVVKIQFTVLPNGLVGEMIPILKGDAALERLTLDAFRQWRFNPLPPNVPQAPEQGVITFRYILK